MNGGMFINQAFDELVFFAKMKARPGVYMGEKSLLGLRNYLFGMEHAFHCCGKSDAFRYFYAFVGWYNAHLMETDSNGYVCWWNYMLYTSASSDRDAFDKFYRVFEGYLKTEHGLCLPEGSGLFQPNGTGYD